jgi:predicted Zn-dependent protease
MDPLVIVSRAVDIARKKGARGVEALLVQNDRLQLEGPDGTTASTRRKQGVELHLTVFQSGGRTAVKTLTHSSFPALSDALEKAIESTLKAAAAAPDDSTAGPCEPLDTVPSGLGLFDRRHPQIDTEARLAVLTSNAQACGRFDPRIRVQTVIYIEHLQSRFLATSRGLTLSERSTHFQATCRARMEGSDTIIRHSVESHQFADVASLPFGVQLAHRLVARQQTVELPALDLPCVISGEVLCQILRSLSAAFVASAVLSGDSFLAKTSDEALAGPLLHMVDDPTLSGGVLSRTFDQRGVSPVPVVLIKEGEPRGLLYDLTTARKAGKRPTGHELDGVTAPSNLTIRPGTRSRNAMHMALGNYLSIERLHGFDSFKTKGLVNLGTGRLKAVADIAVYEGAERVGTAHHLLNLHVRDLLTPLIEVAGDQSRSSGVDACSVLLERLPR